MRKATLHIIEGLDGCGKTTYAHCVESETVMPSAILHWGAPQFEGWFREYIGPFVGLAHYGFNVIADRSYLGELVWPAVFDREPILQPHEIEVVEDNLREMFDEINCTFLVRDEDEAREERDIDYHWDDALRLYNDAIGHSTFNWDVMELPERMRPNFCGGTS